MMEKDPLTKIEDENTLSDLGKMGYTIYKGAIEEGATIEEAFRVTAAWFRGMVGGSLDATDKDDNKPEEDKDKND
jgi:hypothetical protein